MQGKETSQRQFNITREERSLIAERRRVRLEKPPLNEIREIIKRLEVTDKMTEKLASGGRINYHLLRLLGRHGAERDFALAYLQHCDNIFEKMDKEEVSLIERIIASEGADTMMFWTFAPYIFIAMTKMEISERDAILKILLWSKDGISKDTETIKSTPSALDYSAFGKLHLQGLKEYDMETGGGWTLSSDPKDFLHQYTEREAYRVAKLILGKTN